MKPNIEDLGDLVCWSAYKNKAMGVSSLPSWCPDYTAMGVKGGKWFPEVRYPILDQADDHIKKARAS